MNLDLANLFANANQAGAAKALAPRSSAADQIGDARSFEQILKQPQQSPAAKTAPNQNRQAKPTSQNDHPRSEAPKHHKNISQQQAAHRQIAEDNPEKSTGAPTEREAITKQNSPTSTDKPRNLAGPKATTGSKDNVADSEMDKLSSLSALGTANSNLDEATLAKLRKIVGTGETLFSNAPVLALLSGNVAQLPPQEIPEIVTQNKFLTEAMASPELSSYLSQTAPLGAMLTSFGIEQSNANQLAAAGIDLSTEVSAHELLRGLNVDPQRISAEIRLLKDNLRSPQGLMPYVAHAFASTENEHVPAMTAHGSNGDGTQTTQPTPLVHPTATTTHKPEAATKQTGEQSVANAPETSQQALSKQPELNSDAPHKHLVGEQPNVGRGVLSDLGVTAQMPVSTTEDQSVDIDVSHRFLASQRELALEGSSVAKSQINTFSLAPRQIESASGLNDGTSWLNEELLVDQFRTQQGAEIAPLESYAPVVHKTGSPAPVSIFQQNDLKQQGGQTSFESPQHFSADGQLTTNQQPSNQQLSLQSLAANSGAQVNSASIVKTDVSLLDHARLERLSAVASGIDLGPSAARGEGGQSNLDHHGGEQGQDHLSSWLASQMIQHRSPQISSEPRFADTLEGVGQELIFNQISEKAEMLVKDGGGRVRIDIGSEALGRLELAMQIDQDRVQLKIIAASDQIRELLAQQMPKLRESLAAQDLMLTDADVEVAQHDFSEQGFTHSEQKNSQDFTDQRLDNWQPYNDFASSMVAKSLSQHARSSATPQHTGQIEVRA